MTTPKRKSRARNADPVFAAIKAEGDAFAAFGDIIRKSDGERTKDWTRSNSAALGAAKRLSKTKQTTMAGIAAMSAYAAEIAEDRLIPGLEVIALLETISAAASRLAGCPYSKA